jgi:hypothetical protein
MQTQLEQHTSGREWINPAAKQFVVKEVHPISQRKAKSASDCRRCFFAANRFKTKSNVISMFEKACLITPALVEGGRLAAVFASSRAA